MGMRLRRPAAILSLVALAACVILAFEHNLRGAGVVAIISLAGLLPQLFEPGPSGTLFRRYALSIVGFGITGAACIGVGAALLLQVVGATNAYGDSVMFAMALFVAGLSALTIVALAYKTMR